MKQKVASAPRSRPWRVTYVPEQADDDRQHRYDQQVREDEEKNALGHQGYVTTELTN